MITARSLTKSFGRLVAVRDVSFDIPRGEVVGFLGPNGAGKTTTMRMICGVIPPDRGEAAVDGLDVRTRGVEARARIGYLAEAAPAYPEMRVIEYLRFRARIFGIGWRKRGAAIDRALALCSLRDVRRRPIGQLSKGYRQRVGLAAAIVHDPPVVILDEPSVGLDPEQVGELRELIRGLAGEHTVLLSSHILAEVERVCDRIMMIARGELHVNERADVLRRAARGGFVVETCAAEAAERILLLPGVADVDERPLDEAWRRLRVTLASDADPEDLGADLVRLLAALEGPTREVRRDAPTLEQLYVRTLAGHDRPERDP